jgi:hypothetical protein
MKNVEQQRKNTSLLDRNMAGKAFQQRRHTKATGAHVLATERNCK